MNVTIFIENRPFLFEGECKKAYPGGMANCLVDFIRAAGHTVSLVEQTESDDGSALLPLLDGTETLIWWGHHFHGKVADAVVDAVQREVLRGMGLICLHSAHKSKPFMRLCGTDGTLKWRECGEHERLWSISPGHPICAGVPEQFVIPNEEMYGEPFGIPDPDELVFLGWFQGGEVMRSGCVFRRGLGKVFYFQPGHETYPVYRQSEIQTIILNAIDYVPCKTGVPKPDGNCPNAKPLEQF